MFDLFFLFKLFVFVPSEITFCCCKSVNRLIQHLHTFLIQAMSMARRISVSSFNSYIKCLDLLSLYHH